MNPEEICLPARASTARSGLDSKLKATSSNHRKWIPALLHPSLFLSIYLTVLFRSWLVLLLLLQDVWNSTCGFRNVIFNWRTLVENDVEQSHVRVFCPSPRLPYFSRWVDRLWRRRLLCFNDRFWFSSGVLVHPAYKRASHKSRAHIFMMRQSASLLRELWAEGFLLVKSCGDEFMFDLWTFSLWFVPGKTRTCCRRSTAGTCSWTRWGGRVRTTPPWATSTSTTSSWGSCRSVRTPRGCSRRWGRS